MSRLINMPSHAAFYRLMYSSIVVMRLYTLRHALAVTSFFFLNALFDPSQTAVERKDVCMHVLLKKNSLKRSLCIKFISCKDLFTYFYLNTFSVA